MIEELQKLLEVALKDGVMTENKRAILYKKANELGEDKDVLDIDIRV